MKTIFLFMFICVSAYAETAESLGMTQSDFTLVSALTGLFTGSLLSFIIYKAI